MRLFAETNHICMRYLLLIAVLFSLLSCGKDEEPLNPDFTAGLTGVYPLTLYREGAQSFVLPANGVSGQFDAVKIDQTHIRLKLTITDAGVPEEYSNEAFELRRDAANSKLFRVFYGTQDVGIMSASEIDVNDTSPDGTIFQVKAKR